MNLATRERAAKFVWWLFWWLFIAAPDLPRLQFMIEPRNQGASMSGTSVFFRFDPAIDLHVKGYLTCRGCTSGQPRSCSKPGCSGLVHSEDWLEGDEYGPYSVGASECDLCGEFEVIAQGSLDEAEAIWNRRDAKRKERDEQYRRETAPLPDEIVEAWIVAVPSEEAVEHDGPIELVVDEATGQAWENQSFVPTFFPNFKKFRAANAAGDLTRLFRSSERARIFADFVDRIRSGTSPAARAAAIAFYSQLRSHIPGDLEASWTIGEISGEFRKCSEWMPDRSPANETHRRLFCAMLAEVLMHVRTHEIRSWEQSAWELRAAYAAADWTRARDIFANAKTRKLVTDEKLAVLRLQFELLVVAGPHLDSLLANDKVSHSSQRLQELSESYGVYSHRFSPENLELGMDILKWGDGEWRDGWQEVLLLLPLLDLPLPVVPGDVAWDIRTGIKNTASELDALSDRGVFLRTLSGYCLEAMGEIRNAIMQYKSLLEVGGPFDGRRGEFLKCKIAEMLKDLGDVVGSRDQLRAISQSQKLRPPVERMLRLAMNLGELQIARSLVSDLTDAEKLRVADEPIFQLLQEPKSDALLRDLPSIQEQCAKWRPYPKLLIEAQNSWCSAAVHQRSSEHAAEIRGTWERNSVVDYTIAVEIEMRRLFEAFKSVHAKNLSAWKIDPLVETGYPLFAKWMQGKHQLTSREIVKIIRKTIEGGLLPEAARELRGFVTKRHQALLAPKILNDLDRLCLARNAGVHEGMTTMKPSEASQLATGILEAIYPD